MSATVNCQLSIFGNYSVLPKQETITGLMKSVTESTEIIFFPNMINSQQVEVRTNRIISFSNLGFVSENQEYSIALLNDRIDFNYNNVVGAKIDIDTVYASAVKALKSIMDNLNLSSNRLAANIEMVYELSSSEEIQTLGKNIIKSPKYYDGKSLVEWSTRINSRANIEISGRKEDLNIITDIANAKSIQGGKVAILYHIDINTVPSNSDLRFESNVLDSFVENALPISKEIIVAVEELISSELSTERVVG